MLVVLCWVQALEIGCFQVWLYLVGYLPPWHTSLWTQSYQRSLAGTRIISRPLQADHSASRGASWQMVCEPGPTRYF